MNISVDLIAYVIASYLIGSISCAIIFAGWMKLPDPRQLGSGNPGATNMLRTGSKKAAALTLAGDLLKSLLPLLLARYFNVNEVVLCWMGGAAIIGHMYPIYYRFQGGKGVATTLGVLLAIHWPLALIWAGVWLSMAKLSRYSSLSALTATALLPLVAWSLGLSIAVISLLVIISILVFWRHRSNIAKLIQGQESRIGGSK
jgi:glycerol-3-phosphate acyltransferase PlsY